MEKRVNNKTQKYIVTSVDVQLLQFIIYEHG